MANSTSMGLKNPFIFNICWLALLGIICYIVFSNVFFNINPHENLKHIVIGLFYSTLILLINEIVFFLRDRKEYGLLTGVYYRSEMYEKIEKGQRAEDLSFDRKQQLLSSGKTVLNNTSYQRLDYGFGQHWRIELTYLFKGVYHGNAFYPKYWGNRQSLTNVKISLFLGNDLNTGTGTYTYEEWNDIGKYAFQVNDKDCNEIIVRYQNVIPGGIAEGYEIWKKTQPRK
jgi:hypothetical protein